VTRASRASSGRIIKVISLVEAPWTAMTRRTPFGLLALRLSREEADGLGVIAVDGHRMVALDDAGHIINRSSPRARHAAVSPQASPRRCTRRSPTTGTATRRTRFDHYGFPGPTALPSVELVDMETPTPVNALEAKGIGESATIGANQGQGCRSGVGAVPGVV
jgi:aerobic carbon-monoxide dehydrogenase large subunit